MKQASIREISGVIELPSMDCVSINNMKPKKKKKKQIIYLKKFFPNEEFT